MTPDERLESLRNHRAAEATFTDLADAAPDRFTAAAWRRKADAELMAALGVQVEINRAQVAA